MSGVLATTNAGGQPVNWSGGSVRNTTVAGPATKTAGVTFNDDGTATIFGAGATGGIDGNWYSPTTASIGSSYSIRVTLNGDQVNSTWAGFTSGVWESLAGGRNISFTNNSSANEGTGSASVDFSPDGGASVIAGGDISWDVGYTP